jgi:putative hydrolase of the HAD superfamily
LPSTIKAVLIDAGNTLVFLDGRRVRELLATVGVRIDQQRFQAIEEAARARLVEDLSRGANGMEPRPWRRYFKRIFKASGVPWYRMRTLARRARVAHVESHLWTRVPPGTPAALEELLAAGYRLGVISNADGSVPGLLESVGLARYFEFIIDSGTMAWEKPDPRIFRDALRRMDVEPEEALYVGDLYHVDVVGARAAGMRALLLDPPGRATFDVDTIATLGDLPRYLAGART